MMNQSNKCKLFGHKPDLTILKHDDEDATHDTVCMVCGIHIYVHSEIWCRPTTEWRTYGTPSSNGTYHNLDQEYLYDSN